MTKWVVVIGLFICIVIGAAVLVMVPAPVKAPTTAPTGFAECAKYFPVAESYPRTCRTNLGQIFTENIGNAIEMQDTVVVDTPKPGDSISSPVTISGRARGTYFFEGNFPVEVRSNSGEVVGRGVAETKQPWTTSEFIKFTATITFTKPFGSTGTLVLKNDNPSGDPERSIELDIPITF